MPLSITSAPRQLSDGNTAGTVLGQSLNDLIGFYGVTSPTSQPLGQAQIALSRGVASGVLVQAVTSQSPASVSQNTQFDQQLILYVQASTGSGARAYDIGATDFLIVNKPTQQAGLGVGNVRASAAGFAGVSFFNDTAAAVLPTAGEAYQFVCLKGQTFITAVLTPAAVATSTTVEQLFTVPGIRVGETIAVNKPTKGNGVDIVNVRVAGPNQVGITFANFGAGAGTNAISPTAGETYTFWQTAGLDAFNNFIQGAVQCGSIPVGSLTPSQYTANMVSCAGAAIGDMVVGVSKATVQATVGVVGGFVSVANQLSVTFLNPGAAAVSATTNELYNVVLYRANPTAVAVQYTPTLTPAAVGPNSTTSQLFTVTGVVNSSALLVNKTIFQPGLGIAGYRVSNTNIIQIDYVNNTAATITPVAGEVYSILNFQQVQPSVGAAWIYTVTPQLNQGVLLQNAVRAAMVGMGLIAGA